MAEEKTETEPLNEIDNRLITPFMNAAARVFEMMLKTKVSNEPPRIKKDSKLMGQITAFIGLSGTLHGSASISFSGEFAQNAIAKMTGMQLEGGAENEFVRDGVGEFINMIAGQAKTALAGSKYDFDISLPAIMWGDDMELFKQSGATTITVDFNVDDEYAFSLDVSYHPAD